jgi:type II secretion system protein I
MPRRLPSACRAFTLIEVLIALAILAIGMVALLQLHVLSLRAADRAARRGEALRLASDKLAEALAKPAPEPAAGVGAEDGPAAGMEWRVTVAPAAAADLNGAEAPGLLRVSVEVAWADGPRERKVGLTTYAIARP